MKLLLENWRKYLNEGQNTSDGWETEAPQKSPAPPPIPPPPTQEPDEEESIVRHNLHMLDNMPAAADPIGVGDATNRFGLSHFKEEDLMNLVGSIPTLRKNKIVKSIGLGTQKIVYKLDNDHIFGIFQHGYGGDKYSDLGWYASIQDRQFKGQSSIDEPAIHDYGEVPIPKTYKERLKYVEMSGIIPLSLNGPHSMGGSMSESNLNRLAWDITQVTKFVKASLHRGMLIKDPVSLDKKVELVQHWWRNRKGLPFAKEEDIFDIEVNVLSPDLTMNLIKTLVRLAVRLKTTHVLQDIHPGNLGMSIENPDEFVVIDI